MSHKITGPSNYYVRKLTRVLWKTKIKIWRKISKKLGSPRRNKVAPNLYRINKKTKENDVIVIPGKVLGMGELSHTLTIACLECSNSARKKINSSGSKLISIEDLLQQNPKGSRVKIFY